MNSVSYYAQLVYDKLMLRRRSEPATYSVSSNWIATMERRRRLSDSFSDARECHIESGSVKNIGNLPEEMLELIFRHVDIKTLKHCRLVSYNWNSMISTNKSFLKDLVLICVDSEQTDEMRNEVMSYFKQNGGTPPLDLSSLRLRHLYSFWNQSQLLIFQWLNASNMTGITWLEIQSSQLKMSQFLEIVGELVNLNTLVISGDTIIYSSPETEHVSSVITRLHLQQIQHLILHFEDLHNFLLYMDRLGFLIFENLQTLDCKGDAGNTTNLFRIGPILEKLIHKNAKSLRILRLDNFPARMRGSLDTKLSSSKYELRSSLYSEFPRFTSSIRWKDLPHLPHLQEISFQRFPVASMTDTTFIQENLLSLFSKTGPSLKKFSIGQLYFSKDCAFERLVSCMPKNVSLSAISVHLFAPNPNLENIREVMHCEQNILKYRESSIKLQFLNIHWTIIYLTWSSLIHSPVMKKWGYLLKNIQLKTALFPIGDNELQFIIREVKSLELLTFDSCDLSALTDSGITGLSISAVTKFLTDDNYQPTHEESLGEPIQNLRRLHSLKLSNVGHEVTHLSILTSFQNIPTLRCLVIHQTELSILPCAIERLRRQRNIAVEYQKPMLRTREF